MLQIEELFALLFMAHRVDQEIKIVKGEILAVVSMFFEDDGEPVDCKDGFEDMEVLAEQEVSLHDNLVGA
jgi:hypothetical protein